MSDASRHAAKLRERLTNGTEDKIGKALADLLENPLVTGTIGRAFDARERATQAQELALSALNLPTAADIERLTRRLRSVSQRLEGIEDGVHRLNRALSDGAIDTRLSTIEDQLKTLSGKLTATGSAPGSREASTARRASTARKTSATRKATAARKAAGPAGARSGARPAKAKAKKTA
jgi:hypothetical protein